MTFESLKNKFFDIDLAHNYYDVLRVLIKPQNVFIIATEEGGILVEGEYTRCAIGIGCSPDDQYEIIINALFTGHVGLEINEILLTGKVKESQEITNVHTLRR